MSAYGTYSDDYYSTVTLNTEMDLPSNRETIIHYFEQLRKLYPRMKNFYSREEGEFVVEEDKDQGHYRWSAVESRRVSSGYVNPPDIELAIGQHKQIMDSVPYTLSASPLDCEMRTVMFGFDFTYQGNHHQLVADALELSPAFEKLGNIAGAKLVCNEPLVQFALDDDCRVQFRLSVEPRTNAYHVRTGEFPEEQLSVYLALRRYGSLDPNETLVSTMVYLMEQARELLDHYVIEQVLLPLQQNISIK